MVTGKTRSRRFPSISLEEAIGLIERVKNQVGFSAASRDVMAQAIGYSSLSGPAGSKIAALSYFDLLEKDKKGLRLSSEASRILVPTSEAEHREAIAVAARAPSLYEELFSRFSGGPLPGMLSNMLAREFGIVPKRADGAVDNFRQTVAFAGLLRNGILYGELGSEHGSEENDHSAEPGDEPAAEGTALPPSAEDPEPHPSLGACTREHLIPLPEGTATVRLPDPLTPEDLTRVMKWAELMTELIG